MMGTMPIRTVLSFAAVTELASATGLVYIDTVCIGTMIASQDIAQIP
jgi:hypothetical protein